MDQKQHKRRNREQQKFYDCFTGIHDAVFSAIRYPERRFMW
jgi:hypothetical protein